MTTPAPSTSIREPSLPCLRKPRSQSLVGYTDIWRIKHRFRIQGDLESSFLALSVQFEDTDRCHNYYNLTNIIC